MTIDVTMARRICHGSREELKSWRPEQTSRATRERSRRPSSRRKCLKLMDEVAETGEEIIITKNGKPVAKLSAHREKPKTSLWHGQGPHEDYR